MVTSASPGAGRSLGLALAALGFVNGCGPMAASVRDARPMNDLVTSPDGIPIAYEAHGQGAVAVVLVHGWSCDRSYWRGQLLPLSQHFKVVAVDLAGHGQSGLGRREWTMAGFGGDVAAAVEKLDLARVVLVGHSMGGDVIVEAARRLKGRVAGLIWVDTYKKLGSPRTPDEIEASIAPFRARFVETTRAFVRGMFRPGASPALVEWVAADMAAAPPAVALGAMFYSMKNDRAIPAALRELALPVVALNPDQPATDEASLSHHGVEVVLMTGVGHFLMMEAPERFNVILQTAIDRLLSRPR